MSAFGGLGLKSRLAHPVDAFWDWRLGVRTFGYHEGRGRWGEADWASHYQPLSYREIFAGLAAVGAGPGDVFTDLGCGLGRAVFAAAHRGVARATGVELVPALAEAAEANRRAGRLRDRAIAFVAADARAHDLAATTILYFFHAFSAQILADVLAGARASRAAAGVVAPLRLIYANPVFEEVVAESGWLERAARLPAPPRGLGSGPGYAMSIWRSRP